MAHVGIDIEQFVTDPYGSGIQRVLQQLAMHWPQQRLAADFIVPWRNGHLLLNPDQAGALVSLAFVDARGGDRHAAVRAEVAHLAESAPIVSTGQLLSAYSAWLLPEVSYLPSVLRRFELFQAGMPTAMIGYDTLPMTEPANYRFTPGSAAWVSEYFRFLARADSVICISEFARDSILDSLRRDRATPISIAHPGGDHVEVAYERGQRRSGPVRILRLGTFEARKQPMEIAQAFVAAVKSGTQVELTFIGAPSASDEQINLDIRKLSEQGIGLNWISQADDVSIRHHLQDADLFLSVGTEGFGIPVLEALAQGTPVLFDGVQPAAELMEGYGALRIPGMTHEDLVALFAEYSNLGMVQALAQDVDRNHIPTWAAFADGVCSGVLNA